MEKVSPLYPPIRNWFVKSWSDCRSLLFVDGSSLWSQISFFDGPRIFLCSFNKGLAEGFPLISALEPSYCRKTRKLRLNINYDQKQKDEDINSDDHVSYQGDLGICPSELWIATETAKSGKSFFFLLLFNNRLEDVKWIFSIFFHLINKYSMM